MSKKRYDKITGEEVQPINSDSTTDFEPVTRAQAVARLIYLNTELTHKGYHDGWTIKGMEEEKAWIEKELEKADDREL